jgi:hypothetical protein
MKKTSLECAFEGLYNALKEVFCIMDKEKSKSDKYLVIDNYLDSLKTIKKTPLFEDNVRNLQHSLKGFGNKIISIFSFFAKIIYN